MIEDSAGTDQRGGRHPYVKPYVRSLDVAITEGKSTFPHEGTVNVSGGTGGSVEIGPS